MELDPVMTNSLEQQLGTNLQTGEDSDSEEGDMLPIEWEAVSTESKSLSLDAFSKRLSINIAKVGVFCIFLWYKN